MDDPSILENPWVQEHMRDCEARGEARGMSKGLMRGLAKGWSEGQTEGRAIGIAEGREIGKAEGRVEGIAEGKMEGFRESVRALLQDRFPALVALAIERMESMQDIAELRKTLVFMSRFPVERDALRYLSALPDPDDE